MRIFGLSTPFAEVLQWVKDGPLARGDICSDGPDYFDRVIAKKINITFGECINDDRINPDLVEPWFASFFVVTHEMMTEDAMLEYIKRINNPMRAMRLRWMIEQYQDLPRVKEALEAKFKGRLPIAEEEFKRGVCFANSISESS